MTLFDFGIKARRERDEARAALKEIAGSTAKAGSAVRLARIARRALGEGAPSAPRKPRVDAGPVPSNILAYRDNKKHLISAFSWYHSKQGFDYWSKFADTPYADLPAKPKAIIDQWCAELEASK
jgi:hypothetical protein